MRRGSHRLYNRGMSGATPSYLIDALADPASAEATEILDDGIRFRSPFADYAGREDVTHLLGLVTEVLTEVRLVRRLSAGTTTMTLFDARVGGRRRPGRPL